MTVAKFEVYGPDGVLRYSTANRVLRLLTVADVTALSGSMTVSGLGEGTAIIGSVSGGELGQNHNTSLSQTGDTGTISYSSPRYDKVDNTVSRVGVWIY